MPDNPASSPAERLTSARLQAGFKTASKAAAELGIPIPTYKAHETGIRGLGSDQCLQYASAFSVDPAWLMFGEPYPRVRSEAIGETVDVQPVAASADGTELLNVTIGGEGAIRIVHSAGMTSERAKALLKGFLPTVLQGD